MASSVLSVIPPVSFVMRRQPGIFLAHGCRQLLLGVAVYVLAFFGIAEAFRSRRYRGPREKHGEALSLTFLMLIARMAYILPA